MNKPERVTERNLALMGKLMNYLLTKPQLLNSLPEEFELVIFPEDDPELRFYNLELLEAYGSQGKPVVFVQMKSSHELNFEKPA
jgi:hypothetical protein